jgi:hypothetical protein
MTAIDVQDSPRISASQLLHDSVISLDSLIVHDRTLRNDLHGGLILHDSQIVHNVMMPPVSTNAVP